MVLFFSLQAGSMPLEKQIEKKGERQLFKKKVACPLYFCPLYFCLLFSSLMGFLLVSWEVNALIFQVKK